MTSRVPRTRRIALVGLSVATLVGAAALSGVVATSAQAVDPAPRLISITTQSGADTQVRLISTTGSTLATQTLSNPDSSKCNVASTSPQIIGFSGTTGNQGTTTPVGQRFGKLGVAEKLTGESCAQVSQTGREVLTLDLSPASLVASRAVLDIELQKDAIVTAEFFRGTNRLTAVDLQTGTSIGAALQTGSARADRCQTSSSSGPNSAANDNCRWVLSGGLFDKLVLRASKGNFSLMGGTDGPVANKTATEPSGFPTLASYIKIAEECPTATKVTQIASAGSSALPTGSVGRSPINADGSLCLDDELTATATGPGIVDIIKSGQPYAQYNVKIDWKKAPTAINDPNPETNGLSEAISRTTIEFDTGNGTLSAAVVLPWCPTSLRSDLTSQPQNEPAVGGRVLKAITDSDSNGIANELRALNIRDMDGVPGNAVQSACILDRDVSYDGTWYVVSDLIYVIGDLRFRS